MAVAVTSIFSRDFYEDSSFLVGLTIDLMVISLKKNAGFTQLILQWLGFMVIWDYSWWFGNGLYHPKAISISSIFTATVGTPSIRLWICKSIYLYLCMIKRLNWVCIPNWQLSLTLQPTQTHTQIFIRVCIYIYIMHTDSMLRRTTGIILAFHLDLALQHLRLAMLCRSGRVLTLADGEGDENSESP